MEKTLFSMHAVRQVWSVAYQKRLSKRTIEAFLMLKNVITIEWRKTKNEIHVFVKPTHWSIQNPKHFIILLYIFKKILLFIFFIKICISLFRTIL